MWTAFRQRMTEQSLAREEKIVTEELSSVLPGVLERDQLPVASSGSRIEQTIKRSKWKSASKQNRIVSHIARKVFAKGCGVSIHEREWRDV